MQPIHSYVNWKFCLMWIMANAVGLALGGAAYELISLYVTFAAYAFGVPFLICFGLGVFIAAAIVGAIYGLILAALLGIMQYLVLLINGRAIHTWVPASIGGAGASGAVTGALIIVPLLSTHSGFSSPVDWVVTEKSFAGALILVSAGCITGIGLALVQASALREQGYKPVRFPISGIFGMTAGWTFSALVGIFVLHAETPCYFCLKIPIDRWPVAAILTGVCGLVYGVITAIPMSRTLYNGKKSPSS